MVDAITAEVVRNYLDALAQDIYESMCRSSANPGFNEAKDAGAGIYAYDGTEAGIVARAGIVVHSYSGLASAKTCLDFFHGDLDSGDVLLVSDSYFGGSHIGDYTIVLPIFFGGRPAFFTSVRGHVMDQGGPYPHGSDPAIREIWQEGFRLAPLKLCEKGEQRREIWNLLSANNRLPDLLRADLECMIGACRMGEERIRALCDRYGLDVVTEAVDWIYDYSERKLRDRIASWPDGTYRAEAYVDQDFAGGYDLPIKVGVTIEGDRVDIDFAGTAPQSEGYINSVRTNTQSNVAAIFSVLCPDIPINTGSLRPITVITPKGSLVDPYPPAPTSLGTVCCASEIGEALMKACGQAVPQQTGTAVINVTAMLVFGRDDRENLHRLQSSGHGGFTIFNDMYVTSQGNGAAHGVDGWGAWAAPFSVFRLPTVEFSEVQFPMLYHSAQYATDSAAPGRWRGSPAIATTRYLRGMADATANINVERLVNSLSGYAGGWEGAGNYVVIGDGDTTKVIGMDSGVWPVTAGTPIFSQSGGGGGWGSPLDRDPRRVLDDVLDGYISPGGACADYGVVMDLEQQLVVEDETAQLRKELRARPNRGAGLGRAATIERTGIAHRLAR